MKRLIAYDLRHRNTSLGYSCYFYYDEATARFWQVIHSNKEIRDPGIYELSKARMVDSYLRSKSIRLTGHGFNLFVMKQD